MAASLSTYWVKFFKAAGFPQDVATKHAVVFSNNRIKPDMLPDLDKPSLKDMGITLMGDMIAILRYAKKVVEETTCERFLVDSKDIPSPPQIVAKPVAKKIVKESANKIISAVPKTETMKKPIKMLSTGKKNITLKKPMPVLHMIDTDYINQKKQTAIKRKLISDEEIYDDSSEDRSNFIEIKKAKGIIGGKDNILKCTITVPKASGMKMQQVPKKSVEQKRTVFDRLGDSSVTSTTNLAETTPTFNITGVGKDVFKRPASVFNRLGDIDDKKDYPTTAGILKNGSNNTNPGILKNRVSSTRTSIVTRTRIVSKTGTMHADHELNKKSTLNNANRVLKPRKEAMPSVNTSLNNKITPIVTSGKLASERLISISAKARLGRVTSKQVTFDKTATMKHVKKADVFSRLGV